MVNTYIPGFTPDLQNRLLQADGGGMTGGVMPSAPPIMDVGGVQPSAPPIMGAPNRASGFGLPAVQAYQNMLATQTPAQPSTPQPAGLTFLTDRGRQAGYGKGSSGFVAFDPNAQYRMWDERGKNRIVSSGTGEAGLRSIYDLANQYNKEQGKKANYGIERLDPATGKWVRILENDPAKNIAGKIADIGLPVLGAVLAPFTFGTSAALGAALGSAASSIAQGRSLKNTLVRAGLSGLGTYAGGQLLGPAGGAASGAGGAASGVGAATAGATLGAGTLANAGLSAIGNEILVQLPRQAATSALGSALGAGFGSVAGGGLSSQLANMAPGRGADYADRVFDQQQPTADLGGEIVVTGQAPSQFNFPAELAGIPAGALALTTAGGTIGGPQPAQQPTEDNRITLEDINKYLRAAGLASSLFGGGGGRGGLSTIPAGFGSGFAPVFSGSLPRATLPGASSNFAPRPASTLRPQTTQDWYRYGYGPSQSFFGYVPEGEQNLSQAYTGYAQGGMAEGGALSAVNGPGDGRSDEIPAMLSDGEYVIDAETVALLGDGSSKAGAERLDQFRINVRRDKGRKLAKGEFSGNAKHPEHYLMGGRA